jgi:hypothetical protein
MAAPMHTMVIDKSFAALAAEAKSNLDSKVKCVLALAALAFRRCASFPVRGCRSPGLTGPSAKLRRKDESCDAFFSYFLYVLVVILVLFTAACVPQCTVALPYRTLCAQRGRGARVRRQLQQPSRCLLLRHRVRHPRGHR